VTGALRSSAGTLEDRVAGLRTHLADLGRVVVAFSGGVDSALLAHLAQEVLGRGSVCCVTALSPSLAPAEADDCRALAAEWSLRWEGLPTAEMADPGYVANGPDRCARCKHALMDVLEPVAAREQGTVVLGVNVDDLGDHRPGQDAARARGAVFPFVEAGLTKSDIRAVSQRRGLRTWDKPQAACLASRLPYGTPVTLSTLASVGRAEAALRSLGFRQCRVRHHGRLARIEVEEDELPTALALRRRVVEEVRAAGYLHVALDLEGFRSGSLNRDLAGLPTVRDGGRAVGPPTAPPTAVSPSGPVTTRTAGAATGPPVDLPSG